LGREAPPAPALLAEGDEEEANGERGKREEDEEEAALAELRASGGGSYGAKLMTALREDIADCS